MVTLDFSRSRLTPFQHQREDTAALLEHPWYFIASEMRTGKTKIVIDAAQFLYEQGVIDKVLVIAPAPVRDVWYDEDMGELRKHLWMTTHATVGEFHIKPRTWTWNAINTKTPLRFLITNYEFIRMKNRLIQLLPFCGPKTLLVLDESSAVKTSGAQQTKACLGLRHRCGRVVLLNGTPFDTPLDLFSQGNMLHRSVLDCPFVTHFKAKYAIMGGYKVNGRPVEIIDWQHLEDLQRRFKPVTVRRLQKDCLDLPPKLPAVTLTATLTPETWKHYKAMRDEFVVFLESATSMAPQTITKLMRLAQITSGFLGGVQTLNLGPVAPEPGAPDVLPFDEPALPLEYDTVREIGREKLDVFLWFLAERLRADKNLKIVVWCRFVPELMRLLKEVRAAHPSLTVTSIHGGQKKAERLAAIQLLHPDTAPAGPVFVGGTFGTGSKGLNFTAAHTAVNLSWDYSLEKFLQSNDRLYGPGQTEPVAFFDVLATGPNGQKTIDHVITKARRQKEDMATWTISAWVKSLTME